MSASFGHASELIWGLFYLEIVSALAFGGALLLPSTGLQRLAFIGFVGTTLCVGPTALMLLLRPGAFTEPVAQLKLLSWSAGPAWLRFVTGCALIGMTFFIRRLLVQYLGDVAAYISSHKLDRFDEIRSAIRARVADTARAIYAAKHLDGTYLYESVSVVGHSLGSVIAYDALNRLLNDDALCAHEAQRHDVKTRTNVLLTFGSPLDKVAYVFGKRDAEFVMRGRSALAATSQPLVLAEEFRCIPWVNIYSPLDIISGSLELYDVPDEHGRSKPWSPGRIRNVEDREVRKFLVAHVEYWRTTAVWKELFPYVWPESGDSNANHAALAQSAPRDV